MNHFDTCNAPICQRYGGYMWYPDEDVCNLRPYKHFQKIQRRIQKLFNNGKLSAHTYWTLQDLETIKSVRFGIQGRHPRLGSAPLRVGVDA